MVETKKHQKKRTVNSDPRAVHGLPITDRRQSDMWGMIDEIEEKYGDLIDDLQSNDLRKLSHTKMKVTGASVREIPRIQEARRTGRGKRKAKK